MTMKTPGLQASHQITLAHEHRLTHRLEKIAMALLSVGVASTLLTTFATLNALAAQPPAPVPAPAPGARQAPTPLHLATTPTTPGTLSALAAVDTAEMNTTVVFNFSGAGHCELTLDSGDGSVTKFAGTLSFTGAHLYSSASMSSYDAFKDYTATVTPSGNCKKDGAGPFTKVVRIVNPHPQSAGSGTPPQDSTLVLAGTGKINLGTKPGTTMPPTVAATISSLVFAGGPSAMAGGPTVLTVAGTGACKYHLSYVNLDAQGNMIMKAYPMLTRSSSLQSPFPMTATLMPATPAGVYQWTASGVEGCTGTANAVLTVQ